MKQVLHECVIDSHLSTNYIRGSTVYISRCKRA